MLNSAGEVGRPWLSGFAQRGVAVDDAWNVMTDVEQADEQRS